MSREIGRHITSTKSSAGTPREFVDILAQCPLAKHATIGLFTPDRSHQLDSKTIPGIGRMSEFVFTGEGILMREQSGMGPFRFLSSEELDASWKKPSADAQKTPAQNSEFVVCSRHVDPRSHDRLAHIPVLKSSEHKEFDQQQRQQRATRKSERQRVAQALKESRAWRDSSNTVLRCSYKNEYGQCCQKVFTYEGNYQKHIHQRPGAGAHQFATMSFVDQVAVKAAQSGMLSRLTPRRVSRRAPMAVEPDPPNAAVGGAAVDATVGGAGMDATVGGAAVDAAVGGAAVDATVGGAGMDTAGDDVWPARGSFRKPARDNFDFTPWHMYALQKWFNQGITDGRFVRGSDVPGHMRAMRYEHGPLQGEAFFSVNGGMGQVLPIHKAKSQMSSMKRKHEKGRLTSAMEAYFNKMKKKDALAMYHYTCHRLQREPVATENISKGDVASLCATMATAEMSAEKLDGDTLAELCFLASNYNPADARGVEVATTATQGGRVRRRRQGGRGRRRRQGGRGRRAAAVQQEMVVYDDDEDCVELSDDGADLSGYDDGAAYPYVPATAADVPQAGIDPEKLVAECAVDVMQDNKWYHAEVVGVADVVHVSYRYFNEEGKVQLQECQKRLAPLGTFTLVAKDVVPGTQVDVFVGNEWHLATVEDVEENAHRAYYAKLKIPQRRAFMRHVVNDTVQGRMARPFSHTPAPDGL